MRNRITDSWTPEIIVGVVDFTRLRGLAHAALARTPELAEDLIAEMERATILDEAQMPNTVVRMGSEVEFESDDGRQRRRVTLVFPAEADITQGKISVLEEKAPDSAKVDRRGKVLHIKIENPSSVSMLLRVGDDRPVTFETMGGPVLALLGSIDFVQAVLEKVGQPLLQEF